MEQNEEENKYGVSTGLFCTTVAIKTGSQQFDRRELEILITELIGAQVILKQQEAKQHSIEGVI